MIPSIALNVPQVGIRMTEDQTQAYVNNVCRGSGTLYITEKDIVWINSDGEGFILKYLDISIFAVCTDHDKFPDSCIFMLVQDEESSDGMECDSDFDEDYRSESEIRFVPSGGTSVFDLFNCMQECNRLHSLGNEGSSDDIEDEESQSDDSSHYETNEWTNSNSFLNGNLYENHNNGQFEDAE